ncbi:MAG TPA: tetratricopeptide repeat protein [Polyangiaceae bacterium]|nr:tetratricopeptide repeat protein [Polyangiaceae bacterium]
MEYGLAHGFGPREMIPMLERLLHKAAAGTPDWRFAAQQLAEQHLASAPWKAALHARALLAHGESDPAWAVLGLAHAKMGHVRAAARAFRRALSLAPGCGSYAHNLGHMLDVGLGRPQDALPHLARAAACMPDEPEVIASYAHALLRTGQAERAEGVLRRGLPGGAEGSAVTARRLLERWRTQMPAQ